MTKETIGTIVIESAISVHRKLGPKPPETAHWIALVKDGNTRCVNGPGECLPLRLGVFA
jgi:hypothetical protein